MSAFPGHHPGTPRDPYAERAIEPYRPQIDPYRPLAAPDYGRPPPGYGYPPEYGHAPPGYPPPHGYGQPPHPGYGHPPPSSYPAPHPYYPPPPGYGHPPPPGYPMQWPHAYPHPMPYGGYPPPRGFSRSRSRSRGRGDGGKFTCTFYIGIENDDDFQVGKRIIGQGGVNMKDIVKKAGINAKLRLRGKGSGFVEHSTSKESEEPLQLCISCQDAHGYDVAVQSVDMLLRRVYQEYDKFKADRGLPERAPPLKMRERRGVGGGDFDPPPMAGGKRKKRKPAKAIKDVDDDKGPVPPGAPSVEEIEQLIDERNQARKAGNYSRADEIRESLHNRRVVLSDEKGASGDAGSVTTWRYWNGSGEANG